MTGPSHRWDAVVAGVGAMGSAALFHLARRGCRVLGLERFRVPHARGSSHGRGRTFRLAGPEGPAYVPLARRARDLWSELERVSGERLLRATGALDAGPPDGALVPAVLESCRVHGVEHEVLGPAELSRRFPALRLPAGHEGVLQPGGGVLDPERCVETWARFAESLGASVRTGARLESFEEVGDGVEVRVRDGAGAEEALRCGVLVLTAGPWTAGVLGAARAPGLVTERQVVGRFRPRVPELFTPERLPAFELEVPEGRFHGIADGEEEGVTVGRFHHLGERVDPDEVERTCSDRDRRVLRDFAERYLPEGAGEVDGMQTCLFTNTPDGDFVVDRLPGEERVVVAAGFSGRGFGYAAVLGEILADLALDGSTRHDLTSFGLARFDAPSRP